MINQASFQENMTVKRQKNLQYEVLKYLALFGPKNRMRLYAGFPELPTAEIAPVLDELRQLGYVEVGATDTVLLTASGREWIKKSETQAGGAAKRQK